MFSCSHKDLVPPHPDDAEQQTQMSSIYYRSGIRPERWYETLSSFDQWPMSLELRTKYMVCKLYGLKRHTMENRCLSSGQCPHIYGQRTRRILDEFAKLSTIPSPPKIHHCSGLLGIINYNTILPHYKPFYVRKNVSFYLTFRPVSPVT